MGVVEHQFPTANDMPELLGVTCFQDSCRAAGSCAQDVESHPATRTMHQMLIIHSIPRGPDVSRDRRQSRRYQRRRAAAATPRLLATCRAHDRF